MRAILLAIVLTLSVTALVVPGAEAKPAPSLCEVWPGAPMVCWDYDNGCPPPPMYCMPP